VLKREDGTDRIVFIKINDNQYIELFAENPKQDGHLNHISFFTDSAQGMYDYLASRGVKVPDKVGKGRIGHLNFNIVDPDGHTVEIVQYEPDSWTTRPSTSRHALAFQRRPSKVFTRSIKTNRRLMPKIVRMDFPL
jgi:hypothetical protein